MSRFTNATSLDKNNIKSNLSLTKSENIDDSFNQQTSLSLNDGNLKIEIFSSSQLNNNL